jgi:hypothetical protein
MRDRFYEREKRWQETTFWQRRSSAVRSGKTYKTGVAIPFDGSLDRCRQAVCY